MSEHHTTTHVHGVVVGGHCTHRSSRCTYAVHACSAAGCVVERLACHVALAMNGAQKKDTVTSYDVGNAQTHTHTLAHPIGPKHSASWASCCLGAARLGLCRVRRQAYVTLARAHGQHTNPQPRQNRCFDAERPKRRRFQCTTSALDPSDPIGELPFQGRTEHSSSACSPSHRCTTARARYPPRSMVLGQRER